MTGEINSSVLSLPLMASYTNPLFSPATLVSIFLNNAGLCISVHERLADISPHRVLFPEKSEQRRKENRKRHFYHKSFLTFISAVVIVYKLCQDTPLSLDMSSQNDQRRNKKLQCPLTICSQKCDLCMHLCTGDIFNG